jgi:hypothetical protein
MSLKRTRPRKKGHDGSRMTLPVAVVQVVRRRIIKIHRDFDKPQSQNTGVEIEIHLRLA